MSKSLSHRSTATFLESHPRHSQGVALQTLKRKKKINAWERNKQYSARQSSSSNLQLCFYADKYKHVQSLKEGGIWGNAQCWSWVGLCSQVTGIDRTRDDGLRLDIIGVTVPGQPSWNHQQRFQPLPAVQLPHCWCRPVSLWSSSLPPPALALSLPPGQPSQRLYPDLCPARRQNQAHPPWLLVDGTAFTSSTTHQPTQCLGTTQRAEPSHRCFSPLREHPHQAEQISEI